MIFLCAVAVGGRAAARGQGGRSRTRFVTGGLTLETASRDTRLFGGYADVVRPEWIDHNGHMNMGYYLLAFDLATDAFLSHVGLDAAHRRAHQVTTFCLEAHVTYDREVRAGDPLRFTTRLLGWDAKRIHYFHEMHHAEHGYLAATNELMTLHVSQSTRRAAPMAPAIRERLARILEAHDAWPRPTRVGRRIGLDARRP